MRFETSCITPRRLTWLLLTVVFTLALISTAGQLAKFLYGHGMLKGLVPLFYLDYESNVPTWYSSIALLFAAALLFVIALVKRSVRDRYRHHWAALAGLFFLLSVDEVSQIHEYPIEPLRNGLNAGGLFYYTWVIPGAVFVLIIGLCFARFLWHLPSSTRNLFVLAAAIFVGGAIGVEMLSGYQADLHGEENLTYALIITIEEMMEMLGVVVFIHALMAYLRDSVGELRVVIYPFRQGAAA